VKITFKLKVIHNRTPHKCLQSAVCNPRKKTNLYTFTQWQHTFTH